MLAVARQGAGAERVEWIEGDSSVLEAWGADLAVMTENVAQVFVEDEAWLTTLRDLHRALRLNGYLAFESRNPAAWPWEQWNREHFLNEAMPIPVAFTLLPLEDEELDCMECVR